MLKSLHSLPRRVSGKHLLKKQFTSTEKFTYSDVFQPFEFSRLYKGLQLLHPEILTFRKHFHQADISAFSRRPPRVIRLRVNEKNVRDWRVPSGVRSGLGVGCHDAIRHSKSEDRGGYVRSEKRAGCGGLPGQADGLWR